MSSLAEMRAKGCILIEVAIFRGAAKEFGQTVTQKQARSNALLEYGTPSRFPLVMRAFSFQTDVAAEQYGSHTIRLPQRCPSCRSWI